MATFVALTGFAAGTVMLLWLSGRRWRKAKSLKPIKVGFVHEPGTIQKRVFVLFDGAFNLASEHAKKLMGEMSKWGDVLYVDYDFDYYDHQRVLEAMRMRLLSSHYTEVCIVGASMGAINAVRLGASIKDRFDRVVIIGNDAALGRETLPAGQRKVAPLTAYLSAGPVWDFLLSPLKPQLFKGIPQEYWEGSAVEPAVREHLRYMRRYSFTAIFQMIAAIATATLPSREQLDGAESYYLRSGNDETLDGDAAERVWVRLMPSTRVVTVEGGWHVTYVEQPWEWRRKLASVLETAYGPV